MSSKTPRLRLIAARSARLEESEESEEPVGSLQASIKSIFDQLEALQEEVTFLRTEKDRLHEEIIEIRRELDEKSTKIESLENKIAGGSGAEGLHQNHHQLNQDENISSAGTINNQGSNVGVTTQTELLAEAIRISTLPCPTLETNDRQSIKKFILKMEEYKMLGGKRTMSSSLELWRHS
jgi:septal ring factor EnvC (AmiA/AmiB activator)